MTFVRMQKWWPLIIISKEALSWITGPFGINMPFGYDGRK